jgi:hypothetical protein
MPKCLNVGAWRIANKDELIAFTEGLGKRPIGRGRKRKPKIAGTRHLIVRRRLKQVDLYAYLRARFGAPNGFQNFLRSDSSDNLIHWDFVIKAGDQDVYIQGVMRDVHFLLSESLIDDEWKTLILAIRSDFARISRKKSTMMKSFEKYIVFQNKFAVLANLCADLHASIIDAPPQLAEPPRATRKGMKQYKIILDAVSKRATDLYGDCLKLKLLMPIMAEAFINMLVLVFCKDDIRKDRTRYDVFVREKMPQKLALLTVNCDGFSHEVDRTSEAYRNFLRIMNDRNFAIHGNVDPEREQIEVVYFEGKRPLFVEGGDHIFRLFEHLEFINKPAKVVADYEAVHMFLLELTQMLSSRHQEFFEQVIEDMYPGYEVHKRRVTKILPGHNAAFQFGHERYEDDLDVEW